VLVTVTIWYHYCTPKTFIKN